MLNADLQTVCIHPLGVQILADVETGSDWERAYGHPVVMVETFVDPARFKGTCYRASAWQELGSTEGFGRNGGKYYYHGNPKMIFVRQLHRRARVMLTEVDSPLNKYNKEGIMDIKELSLDGKEGLVGHLMKISEPRKAVGFIMDLDMNRTYLIQV
ncbi:MAG: DUF4338 domain-containing protein [Nitrospirae bacterium]|nr:DUF4338 domain-containing protein [Nitrospirota bacterium]